MHFSQRKDVPHKVEYLFGKNGHSCCVFCSGSITIWSIMALNRKRVGVENLQLKLKWMSQRAQLYIIFKDLVYSLQNCQFRCDLLPYMHCIIIDKR